jgi:opacity protein-like surface antigen
LDASVTVAGGAVSVSAGVASASAAALDATVTAVNGAVPVVVETGSWYGLVDILREGADWARAERAAPRQACPNDGEPLRSGPDGRLYCPWDGWRPDGSYVGQ